MAMSDARPSGFDWSVGSVIGTAFSTVFGNFVPFVGLALLIGLPSLLLTLAGVPEIVKTVVDLVLGQVVTITLIYGTVQSLRGNKVGISEALSQGMSRLPAAIGVAILAGLGIGLGMILLIVPGLFLMTMWAVAIPSAVIEKTGVGASFTRSASLTEGRRWRVFGAIVVSWIVIMAITMAIAFALVGASGGAGSVVFIVLWVVGAVLQAYMSSLSGVLYYFLRRDKEGADIETIASVFD
jgi:hypothetical protein